MYHDHMWYICWCKYVMILCVDILCFYMEKSHKMLSSVFTVYNSVALNHLQLLYNHEHDVVVPNKKFGNIKR